MLNSLSFDPAEIDQRLKQRLSLWEVAALTVTLVFPIAAVTILPANPGYDLRHYLNTSSGDFSFYYYAYWLLPLWNMLSRVPFITSFYIWSTVSTFAVFLACRVFGNKAAFAMLTYGMLSSLYLGQFSGVLVGGLALLWWGLAHGRWNVAGIGLILAASKYHTGALPALILILCSDTSWGLRLRVLPIPAAVCLSSFAFYGFWPLNVLATYQNNPPNAWGNISPWHWIGPFALLIWIPPFIVRMDWRERIIALFATTPLGVPYFQHTDLVMLGVMPIGWLSLLGNLGFLKQLLGMEEQPYLMTLPLVVYLATLVPHAVNLQRRSKTASPEK